MEKKAKPAKKQNPTDATMRNVKTAARKFAVLKEVLGTLIAQQRNSGHLAESCANDLLELLTKA